MERHIGLWKKEHGGKPAVAELIIDGNNIEFYCRDYGEVFPCAFVGTDNDHKYKIFTNGSCGKCYIDRKEIEYSNSLSH